MLMAVMRTVVSEVVFIQHHLKSVYLLTPVRQPICVNIDQPLKDTAVCREE